MAKYTPSPDPAHGSALYQNAVAGMQHFSDTAERTLPPPPSAPELNLATASTLGISPSLTESHGKLRRRLAGTALQAHHLNQNAVYKGIIPKKEGISIGMRGNAFMESGSPHYDFHESLEQFWAPYRKTGNKFGLTPTNADYGAAVKQALIYAGYTAAQAVSLAAQAAAQRTAFGLAPSAPVPHIPRSLLMGQGSQEL